MLFVALLIAAPTYLSWRKAIVEGWPEDYNGWLGLGMFPLFSIGALLCAIFYRRVDQFDKVLQQDIDNNTRRGKLVSVTLYSFMFIIVGADVMVSHVVKHKPVQEWEYYV